MNVTHADLPLRMQFDGQAPHVVVQSSPHRQAFAEGKHREFWTTDVWIRGGSSARRAVRYCVRLHLGYRGDEPVPVGSSRDSVYQQCVTLPLVDETMAPVLDKDGKPATVKKMLEIPGSEGLPHPILGYVLVVIVPGKINGQWESEYSDAAVSVSLEDEKDQVPPVVPN